MGGPTESVTLSISEWPNDAAVCSLSDTLETGGRAAAVLLSATARMWASCAEPRGGGKNCARCYNGPSIQSHRKRAGECDAIVPGVVSSTLSARDNEELGNFRSQRVDRGKAVIECQTVGALDTQCGLSSDKLTQSLNSGHYVLERDVMGTLICRMFNALGGRDVEEKGALVACGGLYRETKRIWR